MYESGEASAPAKPDVLTTGAHAFELGPERQMLADGMLVAYARGLTRRLHQPIKHPANPLLTPTLNVERGRAAQGTVLFDPLDGCFKAWYCAAGERIGSAIRYAVSDDGLSWRKPALDALERDGNLVFTGRPPIGLPEGAATGADGFSVMLDAGDAAPAKRYKALWYSKYAGPVPRPFPQGIYTATSPDGIHWHTDGVPALTHDDDPALGDANSCMWDADRRRFIAFTKQHQPSPRTIGDIGAEARVRAVSFSEDFAHWTPPRTCLCPDDQDPVSLQHYRQCGWNEHGAYLGLLERYRGWWHDPVKPMTIEMELVGSRDGAHWQRLGDRQPFLPLGAPGAWDDQLVLCNTGGPIPVDDRLWFYYSGDRVPHEVHPTLMPCDRAPHRCIGLATLRREGYISYDAGDEPGVLVTRPLRFREGGRLFVNADARAGSIRVSVRRVQPTERAVEGARRGILYDIGPALEGFAHDDAVPLRDVEGTRLAMRWTATERLPHGEPGEWISLSFELRNASLYAFWAEL